MGTQRRSVPNRRALALAVGLVVLGPGASPAQAASLSVSAINRSKCQTKTGGNSAFGSLVDYTLCRGDAGFGNGVLYNDAVATPGGSGTVATLEIDAGLLSDAAGSGKRIHLRQQLEFDITLDIQVDPGQEWTLHVDQTVSGLLAIIQEGTTSSLVGVLGGAIDFSLDGTPYDVTVTPSSQGGSSTIGTAFSGSRSDLLSGTGPALLLGQVGQTLLETLSQCIVCGSGGSGDETALLFGLDDIGGALPVTADDYATWSRAVGPDGYTATFELFVPEPASFALVLLGLAAFGSATPRGR